ncbi:MAG: hypothetical protein H0V37_12610 [Chloroflexia bacterium]|nr:hypothetical protein [Chloroflexia bacterium]
MQRNLNTLHGLSRLRWWCSLTIAALVITGCGPLGDDDADPTATEDTISQPIVATDEAPHATPASQFESTVGPESTPVVSLSTPVVTDATVEPAGNAATPVQSNIAIAGTPVEPQGTQAPVNGTSGADLSGSDGTSGATPDQGASTGGTDVSPAVADSATPAAGVTPEALNLDELEPLSVSSCEPESIPPYTGGQVIYLTNSDVNFRTGPGADCDAIGDGPIGINIPVLLLSGPVVRTDIDDQFEWVQVQIGSETGWVVLDVLDPAP